MYIDRKNIFLNFNFIRNMDLNFYKNWNKTIAVYNVVITVIGTLGNIIVGAVCMRKSMRKVPTFVFYSILSFTNIITLYSINLNSFFLKYFNFSLVDLNVHACRALNFIQFFPTEASTYLLVRICQFEYFSQQ